MGPLFKCFDEWRSQLIDGTALGLKQVKLKEYDSFCHARNELHTFYGYPSEFDGGCLAAPSWYIKSRNDTALADAFENPFLQKTTVPLSPLEGANSVIRNILARRITIG